MGIAIAFRALQKWPKKPTVKRRSAPFKSSYTKTLNLLEDELRHLGVSEAIIEADCDRSMVRLDGCLRADAKLRGPGIVLHFTTKTGDMTFPCDTFQEWTDNIRAIALALEALRKIDRYGVTSSGEQYRGWAALPDRSESSMFPNVESALAWVKQTLALVTGCPPVDSEKAEIRRAAMLRCHPDRNGGDDATWRVWMEVATKLGIEV